MFIVALALQILCCFGLGAIILRSMNVIAELRGLERLTWSFALGFGSLGWLVFWLGIAGAFTTAAFWLLLVVGASGCWFLRTARLLRIEQKISTWEYAVLAALAAALFFDLCEGLAPPADGDSLAYHFALPKQFLAAGHIEFVPRAFDGAMPLLVHMTYVPALGLGGEKAMTLWSMVTGWMMIVSAYALARRFLERRWSLCIALLMATTPAVVYGGGSGHIEVRLAIFVLLAGASIIDSIRLDDLRFTAVGGAAIGFFLGAKYTGLFFAVSAGFALLTGLLNNKRRWFIHGAMLAILTMLSGGQSFVWNWMNSGDPVFPFFYGKLPYTDPTWWDAAHAQALADYTTNEERGVPIDMFWWLAYPFIATFAGLPIFESGRTGFGPFAMMILPLAVIAAWSNIRGRFHRKLIGRIAVLTLIVLVFYCLWFFSGISQRIRHLMPLYPLALIVICAAAQQWCRSHHSWAPLTLAVLLTVGLQLSGHLLFARNAILYVLRDESREAFLNRNVPGYPLVAWINTNLSPSDKVFTLNRNLIYLFEVPVYYGHVVNDARVDIMIGTRNPSRYLAQLRSVGVTHILIDGDGDSGADDGVSQWRSLVALGCVDQVKTFSIATFGSRTLPDLNQGQDSYALYRINPDACRPPSAAG